MPLRARSWFAWITTGLMLVAAGASLATWYTMDFLLPVLAPRSQGHGEMYGPITFFAIPVYFIALLMIAAGSGCLLYPFIRSGVERWARSHPSAI